MRNIRRETAYTAFLDIGETPDDAPVVTVFHEWGDQIGSELTSVVDTGTTYNVALNSTYTQSSGVTKLKWIYEVAGSEVVKTSFLNIYSQYIDELTFFDRHPETETEWGDRFNELELKTRNIINTYCGQDFDIRTSKTITLDGSGSKNLYLPVRLDELSTVTAIYSAVSGTTEDDISELVEVHPESKFFIRTVEGGKFSKDAEFVILGNWGWPYVPQNVTDAADYIIFDLMNDDSTYRQHGVKEVDIDTHKMKFSDSIFGSTGNIDADVLLMDYTLYLLTLI
jgi:hypothetical protein